MECMGGWAQGEISVLFHLPRIFIDAILTQRGRHPVTENGSKWDRHRVGFLTHDNSLRRRDSTPTRAAAE